MNAQANPALDRTTSPATPDPVHRHLELQIAAREVELAALEARLAEALGRVEAERERVAPLERALSERFGELGTLGRLFVQAQLEREKMEAVLEEERRQRILFETQLRAMERSTFWRMTSPARVLVDRLRVLRSRG